MVARGGARGKGLTRARLAAAAVDLIEAQGTDALTMRRLASKLGVEAMSLYTYFETKHALELAMCDHLLTGVADGVDSEAPLVDAVALAQALRACLVSHPNTARLFAMHMDLQESPAVQRLTLQSLGILARECSDAETVLYRFGTLLGFVVGHCLLEIAQQSSGSPPTSTYDPDYAFAAGVGALVASVAAPSSRKKGR